MRYAPNTARLAMKAGEQVPKLRDHCIVVTGIVACDRDDASVELEVLEALSERRGQILTGMSLGEPEE